MVISTARRRFNGRLFTPYPQTFPRTRKGWVEKVAEKYRDGGYLVRVVDRGGLWLVYYRKK